MWLVTKVISSMYSQSENFIKEFKNKIQNLILGIGISSFLVKDTIRSISRYSIFRAVVVFLSDFYSKSLESSY